MTHAVLRSLIERVKAEAATHEGRAPQDEAPATDERLRLAPPDLLAANLMRSARARISRLFAGGDDDFLETVYRWLLGREIDPAGKANYSAQLSRGASRLGIAAKIRLSPEGRRHRACASGLRLPMALAAADGLVRRIGLGSLCARALTRLDRRARGQAALFIRQHAVERTLLGWHAPLEHIAGAMPRLERAAAAMPGVDRQIAELTRRIDELKAIVEPETVPKHVIDAYYLAFEDANRGSREEISAKLAVYEHWLASLDFSQPRLAHGVVDIGCGRGEWLSYVKEKGFDAIGVDMNPVMVDSCVQRGFDARCTDALSFLRTLRAGSVAAVTGFHVIEHVPFEYLYAIVAECRRVLADGGQVLFETPNPENVLVGSHTFYHDFTHRNPVTPTAISFLLEHLGFEAIDIVRSSPYPEEAKVPGTDPLTERVNGHLCGPQDFAVTGRKPAAQGAPA